MIRQTSRTILGPIPDDWGDRSIKSLLADCLAGDWGEDAGETEIAVLRSTNFDDSGNLDLREVAKRCFSNARAQEIQVRPGDVLVERSGGGPDRPVGRIVNIPQEMAATGFANFIQCLRPDLPQVEPEYLRWVLYQLHRSGEVVRIQHQTTGMRNLDLRDYLRVTVPYPRREEQARIAATLKAADDHIRALDEQIRGAERVKTALLQLLFLQGPPGNTVTVVESKIGVVPPHWEVLRLGSILAAPPFNGVSPESRPNPPGTPILNVACVSRGICSPNNLTYVDVDDATREECSARKGDFFVLRGNGNREYVATGGWLRTEPPANCIFSDKLIRLRFNPNRAVDGFFAYLWQSRRFLMRLQSKAQSGSGLWMITKRDIAREWVALPPKSEQKRIVTILNAASDQVSALHAQVTAARRVKQSLLQNLLTGRIRLKP